MHIDLTGWTHVHTWRESHGEYVTDIYQKEVAPSLYSRTRRVELLEVSTYRDARPSSVRVASDHDYLMARDIRADATRYVSLTERHVEPCCTAGYDNFLDVEADEAWRIFGAAGHGEWAFRVPELDPA